MKYKSFYIHSLGCAKNQVDSEIIIASLCKEGFSYIKSEDYADFIIINTCGFIETAKEESIVTGLELRSRFPEKKIILAGCLTERYKDELIEELPEIDGFIGNKNPEHAGMYIKKLLSAKDENKFYDNTHEKKEIQRNLLLSYPGSAYVKIAEGCNNCCTYCTIPLIRGGLKSRNIREIVKEISYLLSTGIKEINLVAQDTGSFGSEKDDGENIVSLLTTLSTLENRFWLRLLYIHPDKFPEKLFALLKKDSRFLPYFDIPFQHASPAILKKMGRKDNPDINLSLIDKIRSNFPDAVIRSTFLVGFPGETDKDFNLLVDFQLKAKLDWVGVFTYSQEEGTPAFHYPEQIQKSIAKKRKKILEQNQVNITEKSLSRFVGTELDVLIEEPVENESFFIGRAYLHAPEVDGLVVINSTGITPGHIVHTRIIKRNNFDLEAIVL